jgi:hypothetical protein
MISPGAFLPGSHLYAVITFLFESLILDRSSLPNGMPHTAQDLLACRFVIDGNDN